MPDPQRPTLNWSWQPVFTDDIYLVGSGEWRCNRCQPFVLLCSREKAGMAQKPIVEYEGASDHVICWGNRRQLIFRSDANRRYYLCP